MTMRMNELHPSAGARRPRKRVGRGIGSGIGKTAGRGHKGQKSRSGGRVRSGFEGGQMPLQRRLPKLGFSSRAGRFTGEVRLDQIARVAGDTVDLDGLKRQRLVSASLRRVKVIASGTIERAVTVRGLGVTAGARAAIEAAGGRIED